VNGDNLYSPNDIRALLIEDEFTYVAGLKHEHPERYGVLVTQPDGRLARIVEKPTEYVGDLINTSLYKFTSNVFPIVKGLERSPRGEFEITDAVSALASQGQVRVHMLRDYWKDFGRPEDIEVMEEFLKSHPIESSKHA
jgi:dTDP-glucose pyrophosphorylase